MKTVFNFKKMIASTALITAAMGVSLTADAGLYTGASINLGNEVTTNNHYMVSDAGVSDFDGNPVDTGDYFREFSGVNLNGESAITSFNARAYSQATYGELKTYATATLSNPINPNAENDPFVLDTNFNTNQNGMPAYYGASAVAIFYETLNILSSFSVSSIRLQLAFTGELNPSVNFPVIVN